MIESIQELVAHAGFKFEHSMSYRTCLSQDDVAKSKPAQTQNNTISACLCSGKESARIRESWIPEYSGYKWLDSKLSQLTAQTKAESDEHWRNDAKTFNFKDSKSFSWKTSGVQNLTEQ